MDIERNRVTGTCLRRLRKQAGLTQKQVAARMSRTQSFVSKVENAERGLSLVETFAYAEAIDTSRTVFFEEVYESLVKAGLEN